MKQAKMGLVKTSFPNADQGRCHRPPKWRRENGDKGLLWHIPMLETPTRKWSVTQKKHHGGGGKHRGCHKRVGQTEGRRVEFNKGEQKKYSLITREKVGPKERQREIQQRQWEKSGQKMNPTRQLLGDQGVHRTTLDSATQDPGGVGIENQKMQTNTCQKPKWEKHV